MGNRTYENLTGCQQCRPVLGLRPGARIHAHGEDPEPHSYEYSRS